MLTNAGRIVAPGAILSLTLIMVSCAGVRLEAADDQPTPSPDPLQILEDVRRYLIPAEGTATGYGPDFSEVGYEQLRQWNVDLRPEPRWADVYARLDIRLPCCGTEHPFADESQNCGCGHHQALYGLAKSLLRAGGRPADVQGEIDRWRAFLFPRETLLAEMERRALLDPAVRQALDELRQQGIC
jgi:hypothetical protein